MSQEGSEGGELLSDLDLSADMTRKPAEPQGDAMDIDDQDGDKSGDEGEKEGAGDAGKGDRGKKVLADLFGEDEFEESDEAVAPAAKPKPAAAPKRHRRTAEEKKADEEEAVRQREQAEARSGEARSGDGSGDGSGDDAEGYGREELPQEEESVVLPQLHLHRQPLERFGEGARLVYTKPPAALSAQPRVFVSEEWDGSDIKPESLFDVRAKRPKVTRRIEDMMRWRDRKDARGITIGKESNSRIVEFEDGSLVLYVGEEPYEIEKDQFKDFHHLFVRHLVSEEENFLECEAQITERFKLTQVHLLEAQKKATSVRLKALGATKSHTRLVNHAVNDPLKEKAFKEKTEETLSRMGQSYRQKAPELTQEFLEMDEEEDAPRSRRRSGNEDEDDRRLLAAKRQREEEEEEKELEDFVVNDDKEESSELLDEEDRELFGDDDDEDEERPSKKARK